ncbi:PilZ domain-containing protein [Synechococcus sp. CCY 0621]|uniref:PilZ domain-containing protein n=1 Tax=Synechococcus sp. CCY 0621 TaxID=2815603 RepID=UPI001C250809|nr:PilZ domain-containing protein [Synechococcus sp. CCY 0621]
MLPEFTGNEERRKDRRSSLRQILPSGVPASIHLSSGHSGYVTLGDISRAGACIVRRGLLEVDLNDQVFLSISDYGLFQNVYLSACVKWMTILNQKIRMGLAFTEGPLLPGTILDQYFDRALLAPGSLEA